MVFLAEDGDRSRLRSARHYRWRMVPTGVTLTVTLGQFPGATLSAGPMVFASALALPALTLWDWREDGAAWTTDEPHFAFWTGPGVAFSGRSADPTANKALSKHKLLPGCGATAQHVPILYFAESGAVGPPPWPRCRILRITCEFRRFSGHLSESVRRSSSAASASPSYAWSESVGVCT